MNIDIDTIERNTVREETKAKPTPAEEATKNRR